MYSLVFTTPIARNSPFAWQSSEGMLLRVLYIPWKENRYCFFNEVFSSFWCCCCVCVCVCVCVCLRLSIVKASSVWIKWDTREQINDVLLKTLNSYVDSLYRYFIMQNLTFQLATLSCSHTRSRKSHDLTSVRLVFRTWSFHSAFSRRCIRYTVRREPNCFQTWHSREDSQSI